MKTFSKFILTPALILFAAMATVRADDTNVMAVAVFDFESQGEARDLGKQISTLVSANLSAEPNIVTVERAELEKALGEQELGLSGTVTPDGAAKVGSLTGAKVLVTGRVFGANDQRIIVAKVIGTETSRVYGKMVEGPSAGSMVDLAAALAKKLLP